MSTTIRVSEETRRLAADLAARTGEQMQQVVAVALAAYERTLFWDSLDAAYDRLAEDPEAWAEQEAERAAEAVALRDGLE